ncbi:hypothetical protein NDU88_002846 [Pleurodeles waltl]|uniref:Uncharacterized protein n=1 Tax=Pleurodeles waltl TaxID=8319 RepID=A0AAV7M560_PLEWA|nr:hypothetical protein NDU88_002846 [Pleurodeles waltl]
MYLPFVLQQHTHCAHPLYVCLRLALGQNLTKEKSHRGKNLKVVEVGQFLRLRRNCSSLREFNHQASDLQEKLYEQHYPTKIVDLARKRAKNNNRESLLAAKEKSPQTRITCVSTFTPLAPFFFLFTRSPLSMSMFSCARASRNKPLLPVLRHAYYLLDYARRLLYGMLSRG